MENKLLTIAVPTYNRSAYLERNLRQILPQVKDYEEYVDLIVSDNCSTDNTYDVVSNLSREFGGLIRYNKNKENKGSLSNFSICVALAKSKYIYLLGDDDIVSYGFIGTVLEILRLFNVDLLHYNTLSYNSNRNILVPYYQEWKSQEIFRVYDNPYAFIKDTLEGPSFMSSLIFKKEMWMKGCNLFPENCYGYDWLMKIYAGIDGSRCGFYSIPLVTRYVAEEGEGYNDKAAKYYIIGLSRLFENLKVKDTTVYSEWEFKRNNSSLTQSILLGIYDYRDDYKHIKSEMLTYIKTTRQRITFFISLYCPKVIFVYFVKPFYRVLGFCIVLLKKLFK